MSTGYATLLVAKSADFISPRSAGGMLESRIGRVTVAVDRFIYVTRAHSRIVTRWGHGENPLGHYSVTFVITSALSSTGPHERGHLKSARGARRLILVLCVP